MTIFQETFLASLSSGDVTTDPDLAATLARETRELTQIFQSIY
jgi:hypothetical protein